MTNTRDTMNTQPQSRSDVEALRLTDAHKEQALNDALAHKTAYAQQLEKEVIRLHQANKELLKALQLADRHCPVDSEAEIIAHAAIAKYSKENT